MSWGKYVLGLISVDAHISNQPVSQSKTKAKIPTKLHRSQKGPKMRVEMSHVKPESIDYIPRDGK